ncbi:hypothetical protein PR202_gb06031 [Eleusine coracana subsp. coracana]|uniref:DUF4220 domain-containing protein n=1 Tax=Eleusine coracana subsp. coracana TaxID=191504 RepID=A0AAV5E7U4_ELECO|nr:hypothetical protein PR202_gb06031 [Eleusine coracana subsp. coracana]
MVGITLTPTMKWWEEWQLRILVLGSLFVQFILLFSNNLRGSPIGRWIVRLAYISGDAIAATTLAALSNRQKLLALEVLWVPFVLVHLGGQINISAYNLEDNELWRRHVWTLVTKVAIAVFVFCSWWTGDDVTLLVAAILLFVLGIIKFVLKPLALRRASFASHQRFQSDSYQSPSQRKQGTLVAWWTSSSDCMEYVHDIEAWRDMKEREDCELLQEYVHKATQFFQKAKAATNDDEEEATTGDEGEATTTGGEEVTTDDDEEAAAGDQEDATNDEEEATDVEEQDATDDRKEATDDEKEEATDDDQEEATDDEKEEATDEQELWESMRSAAAHTNYLVDVIVPYYVRITDLRSFMKLTTLGPRHYQFMNWYLQVKFSLMYSNMRTVVSPLGLLLHYILFPCLAIASVALFTCSRKDGYSENDVRVTYVLFYCTAALEASTFLRVMVSLFQIYFPRFYIASHGSKGGIFQYNLLSYYARKKKPTSLMKLAYFDFLRELVNKSWYISNYMIYLLFIEPELLIPGARSTLFSNAIDDIESVLRDTSKEAFDQEGSIARAIMKAAKPERTVVHQACMLTEALMKLDDEKRRDVIYRVWLEMLCYSISMRSGYMIAKSMGEGTDSLQSIWLLWAFMGMETWVDRHHRLEYSKNRGAGVGGGKGEYSVGGSSCSGRHTTAYQAGQSDEITEN